MQRSITHKKSLAPLLYIALFAIYESLSSIYLFLPPLLGVLFVLFSQSLKKEDSLAVFSLVFCLILFEAEKGYLLFSSVIYFALIYRFVIPKLFKNFSCLSCIKFVKILLVYLGFFIFSLLLSNIFLLPVPSISYYIIYYIVIEFFIVSIL